MAFEPGFPRHGPNLATSHQYRCTLSPVGLRDWTAVAREYSNAMRKSSISDRYTRRPSQTILADRSRASSQANVEIDSRDLCTHAPSLADGQVPSSRGGCPNRAMLRRLIEPNTYVSNQICARICARDAVGQVETRETRRDPSRIPTRVRRGQHGDLRPPGTAETHVVWLITQRCADDYSADLEAMLGNQTR